MMYKVTIVVLFLGTFALLFTAEGCGQRFETVSSVSFSTDGKHLAVARHDARDSNTPYKLYISDVSRTVSVLHVPTLETERIVEQDLRPGNQGPAFHLFRYAPNSLEFLGDSRSLAISAFGGGDVTIHDVIDQTERVLPIQPASPVTAIASVRDKTLAIGEWDKVTLVDVAAGQQTQSFMAFEQPFSGAPLFALSNDGSVIAIIGDEEWGDSLRLWSTATGDAVSKTIDVTEEGTRVTAIEVDAKHKRIAIASSSELALYDFDGKEVRRLKMPGDRIWAIQYSSDGAGLAVAVGDRVIVYDTATGISVEDLQVGASEATCLDHSPDGTLLAAGTASGEVLLWNFDTGERIATATPPGRYRPPWTLPAVLLVVLFLVAAIVGRWTKSAHHKN